MKIQMYLLLLAVLWGCGPEDATPTTPANDNFDETAATLLREGAWMGSGSYSVSGRAALYNDNGKIVLLLDSFSSSNGPDLKVYLSTSADATSFVSLSKLKSTRGRQIYEVPAGTDHEQYKFALIWCERFSVLFGKAEML